MWTQVWVCLFYNLLFRLRENWAEVLSVCPETKYKGEVEPSLAEVAEAQYLSEIDRIGSNSLINSISPQTRTS